MLELLLWQNSAPHKKAQQQRHKAQKPKPFVPDFMQPPKKPSPINNGTEAHSTDEIRQILSMPRG